MARIRADGLELKPLMISIHRYQFEGLEVVCRKYHKNRSELVREAVDLLLEGVRLREEKEAKEGKGE